jgi:hypothetical protein
MGSLAFMERELQGRPGTPAYPECSVLCLVRWHDQLHAWMMALHMGVVLGLVNFWFYQRTLKINTLANANQFANKLDLIDVRDRADSK